MAFNSDVESSLRDEITSKDVPASWRSYRLVVGTLVCLVFLATAAAMLPQPDEAGNATATPRVLFNVGSLPQKCMGYLKTKPLDGSDQCAEILKNSVHGVCFEGALAKVRKGDLPWSDLHVESDKCKVNKDWSGDFAAEVKSRLVTNIALKCMSYVKAKASADKDMCEQLVASAVSRTCQNRAYDRAKKGHITNNNIGEDIRQCNGDKSKINEDDFAKEVRRNVLQIAELTLPHYAK